jgi:hypothetical protein
LRRRVLTLLPVVLSPFVASVPTAGAVGAAVCNISGTITFAPPAVGSADGQWRIGPGAISCQGALNGYHFYGQGPFTGSGSYTGLPGAGGACVPQMGTGMVDYIMRTGAMVHHIQEKKRFTLAGAGEFVTPSLRGGLVLAPPFSGDCVTTPLTQAAFFAQGLLIKTRPLLVPPN